MPRRACTHPWSSECRLDASGGVRQGSASKLGGPSEPRRAGRAGRAGQAGRAGRDGRAGPARLVISTLKIHKHINATPCLHPSLVLRRYSGCLWWTEARVSQLLSWKCKVKKMIIVELIMCWRVGIHDRSRVAVCCLGRMDWAAGRAIWAGQARRSERAEAGRTRWASRPGRAAWAG